MTRTDTAALALRIAALYLWVNALFVVASAAALVPDLGEIPWAGSWIRSYASSAVLLAVVGILLFRAAPGLAQRMAGGSEPMQLVDRSAVGSIALRVAGVVLWSAALENLPAVTLTANVDPWMHFAVRVAIVVVYAAVGSWLFVRAPALGERWFGSSARASTASGSVLPSLAFAAVGLFVLVSALPVFVVSVLDVVEHADQYGSGLTLNWRELIASTLRVALGTYLFVGGGALGRLWERLSTAGLNRRNDAA